MTIVVPPTPASAPAAIARYMQMWNTADPAERRRLLDGCVSEGCLWVDPLHAHVGRDALADNVSEFRSQFPDARVGIASEVDGHHDRHRYDWMIVVDGELLLTGLDVVALDADGLIERVDGFFGPLAPIV